MNSNDSVKAQRIAQFWAAYRSCVEANHVQPQRSGFYVRWIQEFVDFQQDKKSRDRSATEGHRREQVQILCGQLGGVPCRGIRVGPHGVPHNPGRGAAHHALAFTRPRSSTPARPRRTWPF